MKSNIAFAVVLQKLGMSMMVIGGLAIASIFLIVLFNGQWPEAFHGLQSLMRTVSEYVGNLVWFLWVAIFIGPGWLVHSVGEWLEVRK